MNRTELTNEGNATMSEQKDKASRRDFLMAGGAGAAAIFALPGLARGAGLSETEAANEKVVNSFCAAWASRDAEKIGAHFAENAKFRMTEATPVVEGRETIVQRFGAFLSTAESAEFEVVRTAAMGKIVINERIDHFKTPQADNHFKVVGVFYLEDGKIVEWSDYLLPQ